MLIFLFVVFFAMPVAMGAVSYWKGWKYLGLFIIITVLYFLWSRNITDDGSAAAAIGIVILQTLPLIGLALGLILSFIGLCWKQTFPDSQDTQAERLRKRREMRRSDSEETAFLKPQE